MSHVFWSWVNVPWVDAKGNYTNVMFIIVPWKTWTTLGSQSELRPAMTSPSACAIPPLYPNKTTFIGNIGLLIKKYTNSLPMVQITLQRIFNTGNLQIKLLATILGIYHRRQKGLKGTKLVLSENLLHICKNVYIVHFSYLNNPMTETSKLPPSCRRKCVYRGFESFAPGQTAVQLQGNSLAEALLIWSFRLVFLYSADDISVLDKYNKE